eukprot:38974-Prymnesium_polylepis.3
MTTYQKANPVMDILTWKRDGEQIGKVARQLCSSPQPKPRWSPQLLERKLRELTTGGDCAINAFLLCSWARPTHVLVPFDQEALLKHSVCSSAVWALREMPDRVVQAVADVRVRGIDKRNAEEFARLVDARQSAVLLALQRANDLGVTVAGLETKGDFLSVLSGSTPPPS